MKRTIQSGKKILTLFSVLSILAVSVFSALVGVDFTAVAETPTPQNTEIWQGASSVNDIQSVQFESGEGTAVDPYVIKNGNQLLKMIVTDGKNGNGAAYYKLEADIYLNDISNYDEWGTDDFDMSALNNWNEDENVKYGRIFAGNFDGDGHYIYGLYSEGPRVAAFMPKVANGATIKNVHFRNSYCVNIKQNPEIDRNDPNVNIDDLLDKEGYNSGNGVLGSNRIWYDMEYATASVITGCSSASFAINNCSVRYAYVKASSFASALIGVASSAYPTVKNCLVADVTLKTTSKEEHLSGVEGAVLNLPYGSEDQATVEGVIVVGAQVYGADDNDKMWNGYKVPTASYSYVFKDVYSNVDHKYSVDHDSNGILNFEDPEIKVVKDNYLKGYKAKEMLDLDWENNWKVVDGDYPLPTNQYLTPTGIGFKSENEEDFWDGTCAKNFAAGTGTVEDPYLIETCAQFYLMVSTLKANANYKIADGVKALYFNDVKGLSYSEAMNVLKSKKMNVYAPGETNDFRGYFDGNGVTLYGIKAEGTLRAAIIPQAGNSTVKNFTVKNSQFNADDGIAVEQTKTEGAAAVVADLSTGANVNIRNVAVIDCKVDSVKAAAGLVACSHINGAVFVDDCIVSGGAINSGEGSTRHAAFVASSKSGSHIIKNSIAYGIYPSADNPQSYLSTYKNVYTDFDAPSPVVEEQAKGITKVTTDELKGEAVKTTAAAFDWEKTWKATDGIPALKNHVCTFGTVNEAWSGNVSDVYAGGNGTANNPYKIDTAERLAQMLNYSRAGYYYALTADIYLNDVSTADWTANAKSWYTSDDVKGFDGIFDGNGFTIYGLYNKDVAAGTYAGLIPVLASAGELRNVKIDDAYLSGSEGATVGTVVGTIEDNASNITSVRAAQVGENVTIEGAANAGGIIGRVGFTKLRMDNSIFMGSLKATGKAGGLAGEVTGKLDIKQSICVGTLPFASAENVVCSAVYTDVKCNTEGVIVLKNSDMIGNNAADTMDELAFGSVWATSEKYPLPTYKVQSFDGIKGEVWSGEVASKFAGGEGTKLKPYLIETPEQMAKLIKEAGDYSKKHFKLTADIYLNDVSDALWQAKVGCNTWFNSNDVREFTCTFDGNGYVVFGLYYNYKATPQNSYLALFPRLGGSAVIKNVGVSQAYIKASTSDNSVYVGGIFGMGSAFYDFYGKKPGLAATEGDEFLVPGEAKATKLPSISNCFVDHTCYFEGNGAGGIGCPGGAVVVVRDCIVTATVVGANESGTGAITGSAWSDGSRYYNCIAFTQNDIKCIVGNHQWIEDTGDSRSHLENVYYYGSKKILNATRVKRPQWRIGEDAKTAMPNLDWENVWRTEEGGTPVLRIFDKEDRSASVFSDKYYEIKDATINFITGDASIVIEPMVGQPYSKVTLPVISRPGYTFTGWHAFSDCNFEYPYEYFLPRDINLYAGWKKNGIFQDFESYTYSMYDCDLERWNYNKPGSRQGYNFDYVHTGTKSLQLLDNSAESADMLVNYEEWLTVGQDYTMTFWVATDKADNVTTLSLVQNNHPDYLDTQVSVEPMVTVKQQVGEWKQYSFDFTAQTNWVSIRATGNSSLYIDDIIIAPQGTIVSNSAGNVVDLNGNIVAGTTDTAVSPKTADSSTVIALISVIVCGAVVIVLSKKNFTEVIEKI